MQTISFWSRVFTRALRNTWSHWGWNKKTFTVAIMFVVGLFIYWRWQGLEAMKEELFVTIAFVLAPVCGFAILLLLWNILTVPARMEQEVQCEQQALQEKLDEATIQMSLHTFQQEPAPEYTEPEALKISVQSMEQFGSEGGVRLQWLLHALVVNRSDTPITITANLHYEFRLKKEAKAWGFNILALEPPLQEVHNWIEQLEEKAGSSFGDYLRFPLTITPQRPAVKGYMIFSIVNNQLKGLEKDPRFQPFINKRMYLEYIDNISEKKFRMELF